MVRNATPTDMNKPLGDVFSELELASEPLLIWDNGAAIAALLTGSEYELFRELLRSRAWASVENTRDQNAYLSSDELSEEVDRITVEHRLEGASLIRLP